MPVATPVIEKEAYTGLMAEHANAKIRLWPSRNRRKSDDHTPGPPPEDHPDWGTSGPPRCDVAECPAAAKVEVNFGAHLLMRLCFCAHHWKIQVPFFKKQHPEHETRDLT